MIIVFSGAWPNVRGANATGAPLAGKMFSLLAECGSTYVNTINTWAEPHNANGITPNTVIDSNDEPPKNNQQRMSARCVGPSAGCPVCVACVSLNKPLNKRLPVLVAGATKRWACQ